MKPATVSEDLVSEPMLADVLAAPKLCNPPCPVEERELANPWGNVEDCDDTAPLCDYCLDVEAEGYVTAYNAYVCRACYADHHGPDMEFIGLEESSEG